jgi:diguanylate cyclase (GGDEF)-like protein/PAS domain S-box-containing protein
MSEAGDSSPRPGPGSRRPRRLAGVGVVIVGMLVAGLMLSVLAQQIVHQDRAGRQGLEHRVEARLDLSNDFVDSYVNDLILQIRTHAEESLAGPDPSVEEFGRSSRELRLDAIVLLDAEGVALHVLPANPDIIGTNLGDRYDHLRAALGGEPAVSNVVAGAATGAPIVAFAVPFETPFGRRVLSGGLDLAHTPLDELMRSSSTLRTQTVFLVDANDQIVAGSGPDMIGPIADYDPEAAHALADQGFRSTILRDGDEDRHLFTDDVDLAPWRIVTTVTTTELYRPLGDRSSPWRLFAAFALVSMLSLALVARVLGHRRELKESVEKLDDLTSTLRASEEKVRRVIDTARDAFVSIDQDGEVIDWNDQAVSLFGWSRDEAMGQPLHKLIIPEESRDAHVAGIARFLATGDGPILGQPTELEAVRSNGTLVPVELSVWALAADSRTGWTFNALIRDISDRQHQQQALHDSEEELRLTQENAATGMALVALDGYFLQVNRALCTIVQRSPDEMADLRTRDITHPDDFGADAESMSRLLDGDIPAYDIEKRLLRPDGSAVWVEIQVAVLRDQLGQPKRLIVQVLDIEERKRHQDELTREVGVRRRAEEAARVERDFSSLLLAAMPEGYLFITDGVIVDVNDQLCTLTEFSRADLVGRGPPWPFWPAEATDEYMATSDAVRRAGGGNLEAEFRRKSGGPFPVALAVRTAHNADGSTHGHITIVTDLTEVKRREDALIGLAERDALTGLYNRRAIDDQLTNLRPLDAVILLDLDYFKQVNDTHGHATGDKVIISLSRCISDTLRGKDWAGRLGGEEFVIVARDGGVEGASSVVERLRHRWAVTNPLTTFSAGIAIHTFGALPLDTLGHADEAMYVAKRNGRNRTEMSSVPDPAARR